MIGLDGRGTWGLVASRLYDALVARGQEALYDRLLDEVALPASANFPTEKSLGDIDSCTFCIRTRSMRLCSRRAARR